jgi:putative membrane-bound dehydrogenase-like protein
MSCIAAVLLSFCMAAGAASGGPNVRVPDGFSVELAAAAPLVEHPVMAGFDDRGRLFVADNAGLNLPADQLLEKLPNMIRMLEDTDGDGRFDRSTVFADKMTFPQGAVWFRGALYVASPPSIWRLEDTDGDGVADKREELVHKFGFIGNAADIHGCFITPTGRIAWCDGRHGHEFKNATGQTASKGLAARVFSCRPDGSDVEVFCGGGMDNPVEVAFTPEGDTIGTMTFYNPDDARHDALVHFVYGGVYPRKHPCTSEFKRTGDFMPALSRFGVTAPSGLCRYAGATWGEEFRDNLFSAQFNTHKIIRHVLTRQGSSYECADEDFVVSDDVDVHPTDVLQDADGSLLVIDTGGWFRIGCPTSQVAKPEIGGGIYRIRRNDSPRVADPWGLRINWAATSDTEMADLLGDPRPAVVEHAVEVLAERGDSAMGSLATALFELTDYRAREQGVWALARNGSQNARLLLRQALADDDAPVRQAAAYAVGELRDRDALAPLTEMLERDEAFVARAAATALGRLRQPASVPALLARLSKPTDRILEHAVIFALIEINKREETLAGLSHQSPQVRRGALIALDQMDSGALTRELVAAQLATDDRALLNTAVEILSRHPDWADELAGQVTRWLALAAPSNDELATARGAVAALLAKPGVESACVTALEHAKTSVPIRVMLLDTLAEAGTAGQVTSSKIWEAGLRLSLADPRQVVRERAIAAVAALDAAPLADELTKVAKDNSQPTSIRLSALSALASATRPIDDDCFRLLTEQWAGDVALRDRLTAAEVLGTAQLNSPQQKEITRLFAEAGPLEAAWLLRAFEGQSDRELGQQLVVALGESPALASVSKDRIRAALERFPTEVQQSAAALLNRQTPTERERAEKIESLLASVAAGDAARGEELFFSSKAACAACHRAGLKGERIGPDLSKIGGIRSRRDLVEAILFPSASLARGYESFQAVTNDGRVHSGLLSRETSTTLYFRTPERTEIRIPRNEIDELTPIATSIMPEGLEKSLSAGQLRDVVAYLESLK